MRAAALSDAGDPRRRANDVLAAITDPRERLVRLVELSCHILDRTSPVHAVIRGAADGHTHAAELRSRMLQVRLDNQAGNVVAHLGDALRDGLTVAEAAEHYSALLSPELDHLLTVEQGWSAERYQAWVTKLLSHDLLGTRQNLRVGDAEDFAQSLRSVFALLADVREHLTAGRRDTAEAAERLAVVMLGSTNPAAETAEAASADATRKVDEALRLIDRSADEWAGYMADVLVPVPPPGEPIAGRQR